MRKLAETIEILFYIAVLAAMVRYAWMIQGDGVASLGWFGGSAIASAAVVNAIPRRAVCGYCGLAAAAITLALLLDWSGHFIYAALGLAGGGVLGIGARKAQSRGGGKPREDHHDSLIQRASLFGVGAFVCALSALGVAVHSPWVLVAVVLAALLPLALLGNRSRLLRIVFRKK
jgi:hypothetical protein